MAKPVPGAAAALLIVGGAGGVGSITIQLERQLTDLTVIATASRPETAQWCRDLGAYHVVDHSRPLAAEVAALARSRRRPRLRLRDDGDRRASPGDHRTSGAAGAAGPDQRPRALDVMPLKPKSLSLHWELVFTRSLFGTADMQRQHEILTEVSRLIDAGRLRSTLSESLGSINAANLVRAHALIESGRAKGKLVREGFGD